MKKAILIAIGVVILGYMLLPRGGYDDGLNWMTDFDEAKTLARSQDRAILVYFTGSDWCGWCRKLGKEILSQPEFHNYAEENLVLLKIDFPRHTDQPPELQRENQALAEKYGIRGFPTVVLLDKYGNTVGRTGYQRMSPTQYIDHLDRFLASL
jgi:protein disulfide-isomerase